MNVIEISAHLPQRTESFYEIVKGFQTVPKIAGLRGIAHAALGQAIGQIRVVIRENKQRTRAEELLSIDQRNTADEDDRASDDVRKAMGFAVPRPSIAIAATTCEVYANACADINTISTSVWDTPMTPVQMLEFMTTISQKSDPNFTKLMAQAAGVSEKVIAHAQEIVDRDERQKLIEETPEILSYFQSLASNSDSDPWDNLEIPNKHQIAVKTVKSMLNAKDKLIIRIMRSKRISDLADIPLLDDGISQAKTWVSMFEAEHVEELDAAINNGKNILTVDDVLLDHAKKNG